MTRNIILDIEQYLTSIENVVSRYIQMPEDAIFIKGYRNPLENRANLDKYQKKGIVSNTPWHPYMAAHIVKDCFIVRLYNMNEYKELLDTNPAIDRSNRIYNINEYSSNNTVEDIVRKYIPNISEGDVNLVIKYVKETADYLESALKHINNNIFTIDISSSHFVLHDHEHVKAYRYQEVLDHIAYEKELARQLADAEGLGNV